VGSLRRWARRRLELLDDPHADDRAVLSSLADVARSNRLIGGRRAALAALERFFRAEQRPADRVLLDVGTGLGDLPVAAARRASARGLSLRLVGVERHRAAARAARDGGVACVVAEATALPLRDGSADFVLCSQVLHHFAGEAADRLLRELDRVACRGVVVADLRRSVVAAAGFYLASFPLRFQRVTRRDGVTSVLRGFSAAELANLCRAAGVEPEVRRHAGFRLTAAWRPGGRP
jgi:predicted nicotinamide N-methyase